MSTMLDDISHLSREIGARPAGTEEERLAAMYIAENIQKRSGLSFDIEDFESAKGSSRVYNILSVISVILLFIAVVLPVVTIPSFILTLAIAVILLLEYLNKPLLSGFLKYGISQNVVSKYVPSYSSDNQQIQRKRKVVLVSHYDSGKSIPNNSAGFYKLFAVSKLISLGVDLFIPLFLLIKAFAFPETAGVGTLLCIILVLILVVFAVLPSLLGFYQNKLLYNEGANCNASANAVLMEIARQLGTGSYSLDEEETKRESFVPKAHGEKVARKADAVPEGANLSYDASAVPASAISQEVNKKEDDPLVQKEQNLQDAKAAVAAFVAPRKQRAQYDEEGYVVGDEQKDEIAKPEENSDSSKLETTTIDDAAAQRESSVEHFTPATLQSNNAGKNSDVPDWFKSAQSKARKNTNENQAEPSKGQRSRFAYTMDVLAEQEQAEVERKAKEEEEKRRKLREQIEAANKAAEEERQQKFAEKEQPFFRNDDPDSTTGMPAVKAQESKEVAAESPVAQQEDNVHDEAEKDAQLSLDERFKRRQQQKSNPVNAENEPKEEAEFVYKSDFAKDIQEPASEESQAESEELSPDQSGPINLEEMQQYAPLDDQEFISSNEMPENDALIELPEVFTDNQDIEQDPAYKEALMDEEVQETEADDDETGKFGTGSFAAISEAEGVAGATGTFAPVTENLIEDASKSGNLGKAEDIVVEDADDSVYNEGMFTDTGAFAGKGYVDMPDENRKGILGIFNRKNKKSKHAAKNFDDLSAPTDDGDNLIDSSAWEGGAFSSLGRKASEDQAQEADEQYDEYMDEYDDDYNQDAPITSDQHRISSMLNAVPDFEQQIQDFHKASINIEVWMVALGAEIDENAGIKAFLMEHAQELRGAIIIDIEGLGAGQLSLVNSEGYIRKSKTSSRMKRYIRTAANKLGMAVPSIDLPWGTSAAAFASKCGYKTLRLVGMDGEAPAYYMSKDDVVEVIDEDTLNQNVNYLLELLQSV